MAIGTSNRIVIEVNSAQKQVFYAHLKSRGLTMREWFVEKMQEDLMRHSKNIHNSQEGEQC